MATAVDNPSSVASSRERSSARPSTAGGGGSLAATGANAISLNPFMARPAYRFKPTVTITVNEGEAHGKRLRKSLAQVRRTVDYVASVLNYTEQRLVYKNSRQKPFVQADYLYSAELYPSSYELENPIDCATTKLVRSAMNKVKCPIYAIAWTPEGRRLLTGASSGEFTLWNGVAFNFETILQAHDVAVRAMKWSRNDQWMMTADHDGYVKYWQANMNNVKMFQAHKEAVRSISFCPTDNKFATASDDGTVRVWDFNRCQEEKILRGHGSDVRGMDWHPQKALVASGSRDAQQPLKLWDPRTGACLATLHDHKQGVMDVKWNNNGNWLISASRDHLVKLYDIRMMREVQTFRGHKKEVVSLAWHPFHESLFVSGGSDGAIVFWLVGNEKEAAIMEQAHEQTIWTLAWHPLGHILASGSNDNNTKFWTRNKPGDILEDFYGMGPGQFDSGVDLLPGKKETHTAASAVDDSRTKQQRQRQEELASIPGIGLEGDMLDNIKTKQEEQDNKRRHQQQQGPTIQTIPGLGGFMDDPKKLPMATSGFPQPNIIRKPFVKQAQREFEKVWNVNKTDLSDGARGGGDMTMTGRPTESIGEMERHPECDPGIKPPRIGGSSLPLPPPTEGPQVTGRDYRDRSPQPGRSAGPNQVNYHPPRHFEQGPSSVPPQLSNPIPPDGPDTSMGPPNSTFDGPSVRPGPPNPNFDGPFMRPPEPPNSSFDGASMRPGPLNSNFDGPSMRPPGPPNSNFDTPIGGSGPPFMATPGPVRPYLSQPQPHQGPPMPGPSGGPPRHPMDLPEMDPGPSMGIRHPSSGGPFQSQEPAMMDFGPPNQGPGIGIRYGPPMGGPGGGPPSSFGPRGGPADGPRRQNMSQGGFPGPDAAVRGGPGPGSDMPQRFPMMPKPEPPFGGPHQEPPMGPPTGAPFGPRSGGPPASRPPFEDNIPFRDRNREFGPIDQAMPGPSSLRPSHSLQQSNNMNEPPPRQMGPMGGPNRIPGPSQDIRPMQHGGPPGNMTGGRQMLPGDHQGGRHPDSSWNNQQGGGGGGWGRPVRDRPVPPAGPQHKRFFPYGKDHSNRRWK